MKKGLLILWLFLLSVSTTEGRYQDMDTSETVAALLKEASDHLIVLPEKSVELLSDNITTLSYATKNEQAQWHYITLVATVRTSDLLALQQTLLSLAELQTTQFYQSHSSVILNGLGVWMRRSGYLEMAKMSYFCALEDATLPIDKVRALSNLAVVERNLGHNTDAENVYQSAMQLAKENEFDSYLAIIQNNLGILRLVNEQYSEALQYFSQSIENFQKIDHRAGELLSGINLLHVFLYLEDDLMFDRLDGRIVRMLKRSPAGSRTAYYNILKAVQTARLQPDKLESSIFTIKQNYALLDDVAIQKLLTPLVRQLGIDTEELPPMVARTYNDEFLQLYASCNWQKYSDETYMSVLKSHSIEDINP
ncbi:tetratricopeptide repeat protein [Aliiglaciecola sp. LCG003]|uniref:tetratricopeptide repeat protein n=1 Tax=Aliiglaciecola sp. LCG003 TaxID=3053655 RepID=UPI0025742E71|nr:tetratricopeptide repeat protein [Aliiglaciecola sp. LCG003]WJG11002.1 tetratricopeptide repeat protein [Aliiglaciecola sp. LCG003]